MEKHQYFFYDEIENTDIFKEITIAEGQSLGNEIESKFELILFEIETAKPVVDCTLFFNWSTSPETTIIHLIKYRNSLTYNPGYYAIELNEIEELKNAPRPIKIKMINPRDPNAKARLYYRLAFNEKIKQWYNFTGKLIGGQP